MPSNGLGDLRKVSRRATASVLFAESVAREVSKRWKRLYNGRSAVERINSYVKDVLPLERHALRGRNAIKLRVLFASITLNVRTLISLRRQALTAEAA